jgi:hypothetical protein
MDSTNDSPKGKACASNNFCVTLIRFAIIIEQGARGTVQLRGGALLGKIGGWEVGVPDLHSSRVTFAGPGQFYQ